MYSSGLSFGALAAAEENGKQGRSPHPEVYLTYKYSYDVTNLALA
jgi:hypothetical protein